MAKRLNRDGFWVCCVCGHSARYVRVVADGCLRCKSCGSNNLMRELGVIARYDGRTREGQRQRFRLRQRQA